MEKRSNKVDSMIRAIKIVVRVIVFIIVVICVSLAGVIVRGAFKDDIASTTTYCILLFFYFPFYAYCKSGNKELTKTEKVLIWVFAIVVCILCVVTMISCIKMYNDAKEANPYGTVIVHVTGAIPAFLRTLFDWYLIYIITKYTSESICELIDKIRMIIQSKNSKDSMNSQLKSGLNSEEMIERIEPSHPESVQHVFPASTSSHSSRSSDPSKVTTTQTHTEYTSDDLQIEQSKYTVLADTSPRIIQENSPVMIERIVLLKDSASGALTARCAFRSLSTTPVQAVMIDLSCADTWGEAIAPVNGVEFIDLNEKEGALFGWNREIALPDPKTRFIDVRIRKVLLTDRTLMECGKLFSAFSAPQPLSEFFSTSELVEQYTMETSSSSQYVPVSEKTHWRCTCGQFNRNNEDICRTCGCNREKVFSLLKDTGLQERLDARRFEAQQRLLLEKQRIEEEQKKQRIEEEQKRIEEEQKEKRYQEFLAYTRSLQEEARKKKKKRTRIIIILLMIITMLLLFGVPTIKYIHAYVLLNNKEYFSAQAEFQELKSFLNSSNMALECKYQNACDMLDKKLFIQAAETFKSIPEYKDSGDMINESIYQMGCYFLKNGQYLKAYNTFKNIQLYKDAHEKMEEAYHAVVGY